MDISVASLRSAPRWSTLKASVPTLSTGIVLLFVLATVIPWVVFTWATISSRDIQLASVSERLQLQSSAYAEQIIETARQTGSGQIPQIRAPAKWLRNMPAMSGVEFTTRPSHIYRPATLSTDPGPAEVHHRDGKIIAEVEIPALSISASASEQETTVLAQWSQRTWLEFTLLTLRTIVTIGVGIFLYCQIRWRESAQAELIRAREAAESATRVKSEFLAKMSHELRTPLNAVIGYSEILLEDAQAKGRDSERDDIARINSAGRHLLSLVSDVLDLSKIEAGSFEIQESQLDIETIVRSATQLVARQAEDAGVRLSVNVARGIPFIIGDALRLQQAILNLISNAVKFTPRAGEVRVSVFENDHGLAIRVADTGIGIPPDQIATALQPFRQIKQPGHRMPAGTGLGLPIARDLIALHGGTLTLASELNAGTTATIQLPAERLLGQVA